MKNNWDKYSESELNDLMKFADGYKEFISSCKTERECASYIINKAIEAGFQNLDDVSNLKVEIKSMLIIEVNQLLYL